MNWINIVVPIATTFLGAMLGYYFSQRAHKQRIAESEAKEKIAEDKLKLQKRLSFYRMMSSHLQGSFDVFIDQCKIRNRLLRLLGYDPKTFEWEELENILANAYPNLNDEQSNIFNLIRGTPENSLFRRNQEMLSLLGAESAYFHELPEFRELQSHLELWLSKFDAILKKRQDYCLIYVGVKEKKPFPSGIDEKIKQVIAEMEASA